MTVENMIFIMVGAFDLIVLSRFLSVLFSKKQVTRRIELLIYLTYYVISLLMYFYLNIPLVNLLGTLVLYIGISYIYKSGFKKRLLSVLLIIVFYALIEVLSYFAITPMSLNELVTTVDIELITILIVVRILNFTSVLFLEKFTVVKKGEQLPATIWAAMSFIPIGSMILTVTLYFSNPDEIVILFGAFFLFVLNGFVFYLYDRQTNIYLDIIDSSVLQQQNDAYKSHIKLIEESNSNIRTIKHDMKNHMNTMAKLLEEKEYGELTEYLATTSNYIKVNENFKSGNHTIDSIINYKTMIAEANNVMLEADVQIPSNLNVNSFDLTTVIGNVLDNGIEATMYSQKTNKLMFSIKYDRGVLYITSANNFNAEYENKKNRKGRGQGLKNVRRIVEKYSGVMTTGVEKDMYKVSILMYVEK